MPLAGGIFSCGRRPVAAENFAHPLVAREKIQYNENNNAKGLIGYGQ